MTGELLIALSYTAAPVGTALLGGIIAAFRPPAPKTTSYIQHFAAGVVFSALAVEVLPQVMHRSAPMATAAGFAAGTALMLVVAWLSRQVQARQGNREAAFSWSYVLAIAVDVLIDGLLLGIGFVASEHIGKLLALALATEFLALGLATSAELVGKGVSRGRCILTTIIIAVLPVLGVVIGVLFLGQLSTVWFESLLAFTAAALLYLVTEELLVEAHRVPDKPFATAMFFVGFLALLVLEMAG